MIRTLGLTLTASAENTENIIKIKISPTGKTLDVTLVLQLNWRLPSYCCKHKLWTFAGVFTSSFVRPLSVPDSRAQNRSYMPSLINYHTGCFGNKLSARAEIYIVLMHRTHNYWSARQPVCDIPHTIANIFIRSFDVCEGIVPESDPILPKAFYFFNTMRHLWEGCFRCDTHIGASYDALIELQVVFVLAAFQAKAKASLLSDVLVATGLQPDARKQLYFKTEHSE